MIDLISIKFSPSQIICDPCLWESHVKTPRQGVCAVSKHHNAYRSRIPVRHEAILIVVNCKSVSCSQASILIQVSHVKSSVANILFFRKTHSHVDFWESVVPWLVKAKAKQNDAVLSLVEWYNVLRLRWTIYVHNEISIETIDLFYCYQFNGQNYDLITSPP